MKLPNKAAIAATTLLALSPLTAFADGGFYVGGSVGSSSLSNDFDGFEVDADSTAFRLIAGWEFNDFFTLEGGYHNFGELEQSFDNNGELVDISLKADGFTLGGTGSIPLGEKFALFGRAGAFFWDGDAEINDITQARPEDTNLYYGGGAKFAITERLSLLGDWTRYELEDTESDVISLGFTFNF
jgi:OOP family OmpA-OmpF porin